MAGVRATSTALALCLLAAAGSPAATARAAGAGANGPHEYSCPIFPANNPINQEIANAPVDPRSAAYVAAIGAGGHLHPDFGTNPGYGIPYVVVGPRQPRVPISFSEYGEESNPGPYPVPANAPVEGAGEAGDRHVLVAPVGQLQAV